MNQVVQDEWLLGTIQDCFYFVTKFFEVISLSATHIYHSALELSPLSSVIRKLYHHQQPTPFPRLVVGTPDSWDPCVAGVNVDHASGSSVTWSPCGRFVAIWTREAVEVRDALTLGLLFALQPIQPVSQHTGALAYSPDGCFLTCVSDTTIIIWDIQTGGEANRILCNKSSQVPPVWSLDGRTISIMVWEQETCDMTVHMYDVTSSTTPPPIMLRSQDKPCLWANGESFQVMATEQHGDMCVVGIFEAGLPLTKTKSFSFTMWLGKPDCQIESFSPTTDCISISVSWGNGQLRIFNLQNSGCILDQRGEFTAHCFSPDGSLFAASQLNSIHIWKLS